MVTRAGRARAPPPRGLRRGRARRGTREGSRTPPASSRSTRSTPRGLAGRRGQPRRLRSASPAPPQGDEDLERHDHVPARHLRRVFACPEQAERAAAIHGRRARPRQRRVMARDRGQVRDALGEDGGLAAAQFVEVARDVLDPAPASASLRAGLPYGQERGVDLEADGVAAIWRGWRSPGQGARSPDRRGACAGPGR